MAFFTLEKRIALSSLLGAGISDRSELGRQLGCTDRAVRRELSRCRAADGSLDYQVRAAQAHRLCCAARSAGNVVVKARRRLLLELYTLFELPWRFSPEQVSVMLSRLYRSAALHLSTPAIYAWLDRERREEPCTHTLWQGRGGRRRSHRHGAASQEDRGWVCHAQRLHERSASGNARRVYGHYECDSLIGRRDERAHLLVMQERKSRYVSLSRVAPGAQAAAERLEALLATRRLRSLASDRGSEFAHLPAHFATRFFLCDAHRADQRGGCEHVNGLAREFFPHAVAIHHYSDDYIAHAELCLNIRPRRSLGGLAPIDLLHLL
jgi:transposase, IS30 family